MLKLIGRIVGRFGVKRLKALRESAVTILKEEVTDAEKEKVVDKLLRFLLWLMSVVCLLDKDFRNANLPSSFKAGFVFNTRDGKVKCSVLFGKRGILGIRRMTVKRRAIPDPDVVVTFGNAVSLFDYILYSNDHDVVNLLLENQVDIDGNLNLIYRFMYMVRHILRPLALS
jgi:hypothetical protein